MPEYIEREAVKAAVRKRLNNSLIIGWLISIVNEVPVADVVPVVRCRDCKHITPVEGGLPLCALHNIARAYNDFCSDGARMDGE